MQHFFYSAKQKIAIDQNRPFFCKINGLTYYPDQKNFVKINGRWIEYTEMSKSRRAFGKWNDYIHLGKLPNRKIKIKILPRYVMFEMNMIYWINGNGYADFSRYKPLHFTS